MHDFLLINYFHTDVLLENLFVTTAADSIYICIISLTGCTISIFFSDILLRRMYIIKQTHIYVQRNICLVLLR